MSTINTYTSDQKIGHGHESSSSARAGFVVVHCSDIGEHKDLQGNAGHYISQH